MEKDARVVLRLRAADVARIDELARGRGRSAWVRRVIMDALGAEERQALIRDELAKTLAEERVRASQVLAQRDQRIENMQRNAK